MRTLKEIQELLKRCKSEIEKEFKAEMIDMFSYKTKGANTERGCSSMKRDHRISLKDIIPEEIRDRYPEILWREIIHANWGFVGW